MPTFRQAFLRNAESYLGRLQLIETMFREAKESDDRPASLIGLVLEKDQILSILNRLEQLYHSDCEIEIARLYLAYINAGTETMARILPLAEQRHLYETGISLCKRIGDIHTEFRYLNNLAMIMSELGDLRSAVELHGLRRSIAEELADSRMIVQSLEALGHANLQINQLELAQKCYEKLFPIAADLGALDVILRATGNTGLIWHKQGFLAYALDSYLDALDLARHLKDRRSEFSACNHLGDLYLDVRKYAQSRTYYEQALQIAKAEMDDELVSPALNGLGNVNFLLRRYSEAKNYFEQCYKHATETGRPIEQAVALGNIGNIYYQTGRFDQALEYYQKQFFAASESEIVEQVAASQINIGLVYLHKNKRDLAKTYLHPAAHAFNDANIPYPPPLLLGLSILGLPHIAYMLYYGFIQLSAKIYTLFINRNHA